MEEVINRFCTKVGLSNEERYRYIFIYNANKVELNSTVKENGIKMVVIFLWLKKIFQKIKIKLLKKEK